MTDNMSPDRIVSFLQRKRDRLSEEMNRLRTHIQAYGETRRNEPVVTPSISPMEHYSFGEGSRCGCATCVDWETRREEFIDVAGLVPKGHKWTICGCDSCRFVGRIQLNYLAATNRRDLLIEMSFHARYHSNHGDLVMRWLAGGMRNPAYTDNWCAQEMSRYPMERWIKRCEMAVSGVVSGAVFCASAGRTDYVERSSSSLMADVGGDFVFSS